VALTPTRDLDEIFEHIEKLLLGYAPPLAVRRDTPSDKRNVHLWSEKDLTIEGRRRKEVYFAGAIVQKGYVSFYFMPVYTDSDRKEIFAAELLPLLKGKSCFHVKELDDELEGDIQAALARGMQLYRERGWIEE
jgi:hypothetical protein